MQWLRLIIDQLDHVMHLEREGGCKRNGNMRNLRKVMIGAGNVDTGDPSKIKHYFDSIATFGTSLECILHILLGEWETVGDERFHINALAAQQV